jgi:hypothetical protein
MTIVVVPKHTGGVSSSAPRLPIAMMSMLADQATVTRPTTRSPDWACWSARVTRR